MTPRQKYYCALSDWLDRMVFILICLDDESISEYFKENMFQPMATLMVLESETIMQLELEAYKDGLKAV